MGIYIICVYTDQAQSNATVFGDQHQHQVRGGPKFCGIISLHVHVRKHRHRHIHLTCIYIYSYIYIYVCICIARRLTFARNPRNSMRDSNLLCCFRACFSHTASMQNIDITCVSWRFCAYLRWCQNHRLKRILKISPAICSVSSR